MEISAPDGCTVTSVTYRAESQEVYDRLREEHAAGLTFYEVSHNPRRNADGTWTRPQSFMTRGRDGRALWVEGPTRKLEVTVHDA